MGKSMGSVAPSAYPTTLANGVQPVSAALSAVIKTVAAAPSDSVEAFPAVTVPPSLWKTVGNFANLSKFTFLNSSSSVTITEGFPRFPFVSLENCWQFCKLVKIHFLELLIFRHHYRGLSTLSFHLHLNYLGTNIALCIGLLGSPVALHPILILLLPGDAKLLCRVLSTVAHVELVVHVGQSIAGEAVPHVDPTIGSVPSIHVIRHIAHALKPTSHHHTVLTQLQRLACLHDALHSTGAHLVDQCAGHRHGNPCSQHCLPVWRL